LTDGLRNYLGRQLLLGVTVALCDPFAVFGEAFFGIFVEGLFAARAADVVGLALVADLNRAFAARDDAFGIAPSTASRVPSRV
jgi:hypothetical protein